MQNFNASFVKNAIVRFGNEAVVVLRAFANPATSLQRLIASVVQTILDYLVLPAYGRRPTSPVGTAVDRGCQPSIDSLMSKWIGESLGQHGDDRQDLLSGLIVS